MFRKLLDEGQAGDNVGALLRGTKREDVSNVVKYWLNQVPSPHTKFKAEVYVLEQRRGWSSHSILRLTTVHNSTSVHTDVTGAVTLEEGVEMVMPGENVTITVELIAPIAMEEGLRFAIREGGRTVGAGVVSSVIA